MKKKILFLTDTLIFVLLLIQIQSTLIFVMENFSYLQNYRWDDYFYMYNISGISDAIRRSPYEQAYRWLVFIVFCLNLYALVIKLRDMRKKELVKGIYRGFIIFNMAFVVLKVLEFWIDIYYRMSV